MNPEVEFLDITGVDILAPASSATLVTFGDSITDGDQSTPDTNGMWPAVLAARLQANKATAGIGVVNAGIAGNRVLGDGGALARMDHDVTSQPGVKWIMLLEGINDISGGTRANSSPMLTADDLIAAYREMIGVAHLHGLKIIGCTITPFGGSSVYTDAGEAVRMAVNDWIRMPGNFDAFVDFDAAVRDPKDPKRFRPEVDSPDMLHPGDSGYKLMAQSVYRSLPVADDRNKLLCDHRPAVLPDRDTGGESCCASEGHRRPDASIGTVSDPT